MSQTDSSFDAPWRPYREPLRTTLTRTITIAVVAAAIVARALTHSWSFAAHRWPLLFLLMLWPSFGGHWIELWFLNWLRPRLSNARGIQVAARLAVWFGAGIIFAIGVVLTSMALARVPLTTWPPLWIGGLAFIGVELIAHIGLQLRGQASFYNGRG